MKKLIMLTDKAAIWLNKQRIRVRKKLEDQAGVGTVEVVLLILVAVGLVLIFKDRITALVQTIFGKISSQAGKV